MAMTLSSMKTKVATATVTWQDETVDIGFFPGALTPAYLEMLQESAREAKAAGTKAPEEGVKARSQFEDLVLPILAWWDVLDEEGERLPVTTDTIREMPLSFLTATVTATQASMRPPARAGSSAG